MTGRQAYGGPDRFALINSLARWRGRYSWFALPALVVWLAFWTAAGPRDNIPEILGGLFLLAIHASILLRQRGLDDPEQNFVELTEEYIRIQEFMGMAIRVAYADIAAVRPATKIPLLRRGFVMIPKRDVPSYFEIVLRKASLARSLPAQEAVLQAGGANAVRDRAEDAPRPCRKAGA